MNIAKTALAALVTLTMAFQPFTPTAIAYAASEQAEGATAAGSPESTSSAEAQDAETEEADGSDNVAAQSAESEVVAGGEDAEQVVVEEASVMQSEAAALEARAADYEITTLNQLKTALSGKVTGDIIDDGTSITKFTAADQPGALIVLSHANPALYQNANISLGNTSTGVDLSGTTSAKIGTEVKTLSFASDGLGSSEYPFKGFIAGLSSEEVILLKLSSTLFGALDISKRSSSEYLLQWVGDTNQDTDRQPMFAKSVQGASGENASGLTVKMTLPDDDNNVNQAVSAPLIGSTSGKVDLTVSYTLTNTKKTPTEASIKQTGTNAGLLVNTVESGELTLKSLSFPSEKFSKVNIESLANGTVGGNAGYLIGQVKAGASFDLACSIETPAAGAIKASPVYNVKNDGERCAAGGLVGKANNATVSITAADPDQPGTVDTSNLAVDASFAGGLVGLATNLSFAICNARITPSKTVGSSNAYSAGGLFGSVSFKEAVEFSAENLNIDTENNDRKVTAYEYAGGMFGTLLLAGSSATVSAKGTDSKKLKLTVSLEATKNAGGNESDRLNNGNAGGIVGVLMASDGTVRGKLDVQQVEVNATFSAGRRFGGVVGLFCAQGYLDAKDVAVTATLPDSMDEGFGGLAGGTKAEVRCTIASNNLTVSTKSKEIVKGGGVVGSANAGATVKLSGTTNLDDVRYKEDTGVGQLVGSQDSALIFATGSGADDGWTFKRSNRVYKVDDIGNYGEVIRLSEGRLGASFITLSDDGAPVINSSTQLLQSNGAYTLSGVQDFAVYAIAWQTRGWFSAIDGVSSNAWNSICSSNIVIKGDINLSGTGITGLSRDSGETNAFSGTISGTKTDGGSYSVFLAIGESYGKRGDASAEGEGSGRIYRHGQLGLFAIGNGNTQNLTINGTIDFNAKADISAGGYAAENSGGSITLSNVSLNPKITVRNERKEGKTYPDDYKCFVGSAFGSVRDGSDSIAFGENCAIGANISTPEGESVVGTSFIGGAIGHIDDAARVTVKAAGLSIAGTINVVSVDTVLPAGGFIAYIEQSESLNSCKKSVTINDLDLSELNLSFTTTNIEKSEDSDDSSSDNATTATGGFLGYNWAQTGVNIASSDNQYAIRASNSVLNGNDVDSLGGLVYHAGGHWTVGDKAVDYAGATIEGVSKKLGLMVCQGGRGSEVGRNGSRITSSLYLESTADWASSYVFSSNDQALCLNVQASCFDEWVANTVSVVDADTNDIFSSNENGVVSLHTTGEGPSSLNMDDSVASNRNSYVNRTEYGKNHQSNASSRYYYNLDKIERTLESNACIDRIDSSAKLLYWSVWQYADNDIKTYFANGVSYSNYITGIFDMEGYSYYPIDLYNKSVDITNAKLTFCNEKIETLETGVSAVPANKSTKADSQHWGMHCAVFRNLTAEKNDYQLTVSNVQFAGTIGMLNNNSGVLLCGIAKGSIEDSTLGTYTVRVENETSRNLPMLNNLRITSFTENCAYAPLLLNGTGSASALVVKGVSAESYEPKAKVATSLVGNVGDNTSQQVSVTFSLIKLASTASEALFTQATLLNRFSYAANGTGTYNYTKQDDSDNWVTYGKEIDGTAQYPHMQKWYAGSSHVDENLTTDKTNNVVADDEDSENGFKKHGYLPYVHEGYDSTKKLYELAVNHEVVNLIEGCGTYGHPYQITDSAQFERIKSIINSSSVEYAEMQVRVTNKQDTLHTESGEFDKIYTYSLSSQNWACGGDLLPIDNLTMRRYLASAYYQIAADITLTDFDGLGVIDSPFRGVIVGSNEGSITLEHNSGSIPGLIKYSYGSVIKDLAITYCNAENAGDNVIAYAKKDSDYYTPGSFFGGVIGCVMGGDNILDGVTVNVPNGNSFKVACAKGTNDKGKEIADSDRLVPIGGYVGVVVGGGVLFRNSSGKTNVFNNWNVKDKLLSDCYYNNPYLGRMLNGYAFSEGCELEGYNVISETSNYKINKIEKKADKPDISTSDFECIDATNFKATTTINTAQGLLILSGIISSGAAAGPTGGKSGSSVNTADRFLGTRAYLGGTSSVGGEDGKRSFSFGNNAYGKVRNAAYTYIGESTDSAKEDFAKSVSDDTKAPGIQDRFTAFTKDDCGELNTNIDGANTPYLVTNYCSNKKTAYICASPNDSTTCFANFAFSPGATIDMRVYGNGYLGLSARYVTPAALDNSSDLQKHTAKYTYSVNPQIGSICGNNATLEVNKQEQEYDNDDYHTIGVGALFCTAGFRNVPNEDANEHVLVNNLKLSNTTLSLSYFDEKTLSDVTFCSWTDGTPNQNQRLRSIVGVGGIAGLLSPNEKKFEGGSINNVRVIDNTRIISPGGAGSLFGMAAYGTRTNQDGTTGTNGQRGYFVYAGTSNDTDLNSMRMALSNCSYSGITVTADRNAGGFFGNLAAGGSGSGLFVDSDTTVGNASTITSNGKRLEMGWGQDETYAGGVAGWLKFAFNVGEETSDSIITFSGVSVSNGNELASGDGVASAGGVIGYLENPSDCGMYGVSVDGGSGNNQASISGRNNIGGLVGRIYATASPSPTISYKKCSISNMNFTASFKDRGNTGGIIGRYDQALTINIADILVRDCVFKATLSGCLIGSTGSGNNASSNVLVSNCKLEENDMTGEWSGLMVGHTSSQHAWSNILLKGNKLSNQGTNKAEQGLLTGDLDADYCPSIKVAGLDVELSSEQVNSSLPNLILRTSKGKEFLENGKSYIAYTNYNNVAHSANDASSLYCSSSVDPYVNTLPVGGMLTSGSDTSAAPLVISDDNTNKSLFGDGMNPNLANPDKDGSIVKTSEDTKGQFVYKNASRGSDNNISAANNISTIGAKNEKSALSDYKDFDVLVLTSDEEKLISRYLNTVTNGGYSAAKKLGAVKAETKSFQYDGNGVLRADTSGTRKALEVRNSGTSDMDFAITSGYDNTLNRITLLTVTFEAVEGQTYVVHVPIVVQRMVQIDFTATLREGTYYKASDFSGLGASAHVLANYGSSVGGYLTYKYNTQLGAISQFDWNSYLNAGGSMREASKTLLFQSGGEGNGSYPAGTQLTLVDTAHDNKAYQYEVPKGNSIDSLKLSQFTAVEDASQHYADRWISDIMNVSAQPSNEGAWVEESDVSKATASAKLNGETKYFRPWVTGSDSNDASRYALAVEDLTAQPEENFFLVIRFPEEGPAKGIKGGLNTLVSLSVPSQVNNKLRDTDALDGLDGTPSTYNILSGYTQKLVDNNNNDNKDKLAQTGAGYQLPIDVSDTVTFASSQLYNNDDHLYYRLNAALGQYEQSGGNAVQTDAIGFPSQSSGTATFYVRSGDAYYAWNSVSGEWYESTQEQAAITQEWTSGTEGKEMELVLTKDNKSVDFAKLRNLLTADADGMKSFTVDMKMTVTMNDEAHKKGIAASSKKGEDAFTKVVYRGTLATSTDGFDHSTMTQTQPGKPGYYRDETGDSVISLTAEVPTELGINIDDLASGDGTIHATGVYDFDGMVDRDELLGSAGSVRYEVKLQKRKDINGSYEYVDNITDYVRVSGGLFIYDSASKAYVWTDSTLASRVLGQPRFAIPFEFKVDVEKDKHTYANYRLVLSAMLYDGQENQINVPANGSDYITYTLTRVNLNGI